MLNAEMATIVDTSDEWIVQRSGIRQRHIAAEGETTADLGENPTRLGFMMSMATPKN